MQRLFVDTAAWIALEAANDQYHGAAMTLLHEAGTRYRWTTTNWVIWESVTWLRRRVNHQAAVQFGGQVRASSLLERVIITPEHEARAWEIFVRHRDKDFSYVDCASFAVMESLGIGVAFTFDRHFARYGLRTVPETSG